MDKVFVAQNVANKLFATENSIDKALADASNLVAELLQARQELNLSVVVADGAIAKAAKAVTTLSDARTTIVQAHADLEEARLRVGIRTKLIGNGDKTGAMLPAVDLQRVG